MYTLSMFIYNIHFAIDLVAISCGLYVIVDNYHLGLILFLLSKYIQTQKTEDMGWEQGGVNILSDEVS